MSDTYPIDSEMFYKSVHQALKAWDKHNDQDKGMLSELTLFHRPKSMVPGPETKRNRNNQILREAMTRLNRSDLESYKLLEKRFWEGRSQLQMMTEMGYSQSQVNHFQRRAFQALAEEVRGLELTYLQEKRSLVLSAIEEHPRVQLFGVTDSIKALVELIKQPDGPHLITLKGLGGIGKTTMALEIARRVAAEYQPESIQFVTVENPQRQSVSAESIVTDALTRLAKCLQTEKITIRQDQLQRNLRQELTHPHLIIMDNLEDREVVTLLLEALPTVNSHSRILLTSRILPPPGSIGYLFELKEIDEQSAAELIRSYGKEKGVGEITTLSAADLANIYHVVGGHPLALKLIVGLLLELPLSAILTQLKHGLSNEGEEMYSHIYQYSWSRLNENARRLLLSMLNVTTAGAHTQRLQRISGLGEIDFLNALRDLGRRSLLEQGGGLDAVSRMYRIHRLTETFLRSDILSQFDDE